MFLRKQFESSLFVIKLNGRDSAVCLRINAVIRSVSLSLVFEHLNIIALFLQTFLKCLVCKQEKHFAFCARHCPKKCNTRARGNPRSSTVVSGKVCHG